MNEHHSPASIAEHILNNDRFSQWLDVKIIQFEDGPLKISKMHFPNQSTLSLLF